MNTIGTRANESSEAEYITMWVQTVSERHCKTCGVIEERWVLHDDLGHRVAEATFCPVCYPDLEKIFHTPEAASNAA